MKQYASAVSDLYRTSGSYRGARSASQDGSIFAAIGRRKGSGFAGSRRCGFLLGAFVSDSETVLVALRDELIEVKPAAVEPSWGAPAPQPENQAGSATMLDVRIDQAPALVKQADAFDPLRALLRSAQPTQMLQVGSAIAPSESGFVQMQMGAVIVAGQLWDAPAVQRAVSLALQPGLTAGQMGLGWIERSGKSRRDSRSAFSSPAEASTRPSGE